MAWTLEYANRCERNGISGAAYSKWTEFSNHIRQGTHPRTASEQMGHLGYERLSGGVYSVRLSQGDRIYFTLDEANEVCTVEQIGGHR